MVDLISCVGKNIELETTSSDLKFKNHLFDCQDLHIDICMLLEIINNVKFVHYESLSVDFVSQV